jgi:hypothetical protein
MALTLGEWTSGRLACWLLLFGRDNDRTRRRKVPMGQVNVNTPGGGTTGPAGEPPGSSSAGFILGIIIAILIIAALIYFLVLAPGGGGNGDGGGDTEPEPSALVLHDFA